MGNILEVAGVEKKYPGVVANRDVSLLVREGSIHAIIGENGAGKSTLMKTLYGLIRPDAGSIKAFGKEVSLKSPQDAIALGIGMVHQHFKLADNATVLENVILGGEPSRFGFVIKYDEARKKLLEIAKTYHLDIDPDESGHGGGDQGVIRDFVAGLRGRPSIHQTTARTSLQSHLLAFAAEHSRTHGGVAIEISSFER